MRDWLGTGERENQGAAMNPEGSPAVMGRKPFTHEQHAPS